MKKVFFTYWVMVVITMWSCSLYAMAASPVTTVSPEKLIEPLKLSTNNLKQEERGYPNNFGTPAYQAKDNTSVLWQAQIDVATAETHREDASITRLSDGSFIGIYTSGAGEKVYQGMVRKISSTGSKIWETELQPGICSVADCAAETENGSILVAGTTFVNGSTKIFLSKLSGQGEILKTKILEDDYNSGFSLKIIPWVNDKYVICSYMTSSDGYTDNVFNVVNSDLDVSKYIRKEAFAEMRDAYILDNFIVSSSFEQIMAVDLNDTDSMYTLSGNFDRSVQLGNSLCIPSNSGLSSPITMNCYTIGTNGLDKKWSTSLSNEGISWKQFVNYTYAINNEVYLITKDGYKINIVKFDAEGKATVIGEDMLYASQYFDEYDFIYGFGISADGSMHLLGMSSWKIYVANFNASGELTSEQKIVPDSGYSWAYTLYNQSTFANDKFDICGYMLLKNADSEFTTYFAEINPDDLQNPTSWCSVATIGKVTNIFPTCEAADENGNLYVSAQSGNKAYVIKYGNEGQLQWTSPSIPFNGDKLTLSYVSTLGNGNIAAFGITENQSTWKYENIVVCLNPQGEIVWTKQFGDDQICMNAVAAGMITDKDNIQVFYNGYLNNDGGLTGLAMTTLDYSGTIVETKTIPINGVRFRIAFVKEVYENKYIAGGYTFGDDNLYKPSAITFDNHGTILSTSISDKYIKDNGYTYSDASEAEDGSIFLSGMTYNASPSKGIYAIVDKEGNYITQSDPEEHGYFRSCATNGNVGIIIGSFEDTELNQVKGRVISLNSNGNNNWDKSFAIDDYDTYFLFGCINDNNLSIAGYTEDYYTSLLTESMFTIGLDGNEVNRIGANQVNNINGTYEMTNAIDNKNMLFTLSHYSMPFDSNLRMGNIICFQSKDNFSSVESLLMSSEEISLSIDNGIIKINSEEVENLTLYTIDGRMISSGNGNQLNVASISKGIYLLVIDANGKSFTRKIML